MSGGSYDYLCHSVYDAQSLGENYYNLKRMADRIKELRPGTLAEYHTQTVVDLMDDAVRVAQRLENVWHAVEWYDSCDYGRDQVDEAIDEYSGQLRMEP